VQRKISESLQVAEFFHILNQTNWCKFDDTFYLVSRRWFDKWKDYVCYDYIVKNIVEDGKKEEDLSRNKLITNNSTPPDIHN
jgi:hypothetical protein